MTPAPQDDATPDGAVELEPAEAPADADPVAGRPSPASSSVMARWLPWGLVAALTVGCVILATLYGDAREEVRRLQHDQQTPAAASATPGGTGGTPGTAPITAAPTTGAQAEAILKLAHRDPSDPRALGKADAPIVLIEWADYRCPFCASWYQQTLPSLVPYVKSGSLRIEFRDLVIFGDESQAAAQAAHAAGLQGHFWDYSQGLWALHTGNGHPEITDAMLQDMASQAGVPDVAKFNADRNSQAVKDAVAKDTAEATQLGLKATPFFLVNTTQVPGAYPSSTFVSIVQQYGGKPAQ